MQVHWPTAAVVIAMLASVVAVALVGTPTVGVAAAGLLGTLVAGLMRSMLSDRDRDDDAPPTERTPQIPPAPKSPRGLSFVAMTLLCSGCALLTPKNERTALDAVQTACIITHAEIADATVAQLCGIEEALLPLLRTLVGEQRTQIAREKRRVGGVFSSGGGGGSPPPTGTGFVTVTGGAQDPASLVFPLAEAKGGTAATTFPGVRANTLLFSTVDHAQSIGYTWIVADFTAGLSFVTTKSGLVVTGVRYYFDAADHLARAIKFSLVDMTGPTLVESKTSGSITAGTLATLSFASTHALTAFTKYAVCARTTTGTLSPFDAGSNKGPIPHGTAYVPKQRRPDGAVYLTPSAVSYAAGDAPTGIVESDDIGVRVVPLEPVFQ